MVQGTEREGPRAQLFRQLVSEGAFRRWLGVDGTAGLLERSRAGGAKRLGLVPEASRSAGAVAGAGSQAGAGPAGGCRFGICQRNVHRTDNLSISPPVRSEEHTSELQSRGHIVCRLLLE